MPNRSADLARRLTDQLWKLELARRLRIGEGVARYSRAISPLSNEWLVNTRKLIATGQLASAQEALTYVNARAKLAGGQVLDLEDAIRGVDRGYGGNGRLGLTLSRYQRLGRQIADRDGDEAARLWMERRTKRAAGDLAWGAGQETMRAAIDLHPDATGYRRIASAGACGACLALATGAILPASEVFQRHPSCRCSIEPAFQGEPAVDRPTGEEYFKGLPEDEQVAILGPERLAAYRAGEFKFADLAANAYGRRSGTGLHIRPLDGLQVSKPTKPIAGAKPPLASVFPDDPDFEIHLDESMGKPGSGSTGERSLILMAGYANAKALNSKRRANKPLTGDLKEIDDGLTQLVKPIGREAVVYRAVDDVTKLLGTKVVEGASGLDRGWMSTSVRYEAANRHLEQMLAKDWPGEKPESPALLVIRVRPGQQAVWRGNVGPFSWQRELFLKYDTTIEVVRIIERTGEPPVIICVAR